MRSTSPPKSAWPGVSTILMRVSLPQDGGALRQDGDAALALEVVAIHRLRFHLLVLAEGAGLLQQRVDQRRLAVIDMRNDRNVAKLHLRFLKRFRALSTAGGARHRLPAARQLVGPVAHSALARQHAIPSAALTCLQDRTSRGDIVEPAKQDTDVRPE